MFEDQLLVLAFTDVLSTRHILGQFFGAGPDDSVKFENNYFKASVRIRILYEPEHDLLVSDEDWKPRLSHFPAVALLSSSQEPETVSKCKTLWNSLHALINEDAIRILFVAEEDANEKDTYKLVEWGVTRQIEVVNMFLCREDGIDLSVRLKRILECAPWRSSSRDTIRNEETVPQFQSNLVNKDQTRKPPLTGKDLSKPTRLRRGLKNSDVAKLVDDLLLADDTDSDT